MKPLHSRRGLVAALAVIAHVGLLWLALHYQLLPDAVEPVYVSLQVLPIQVPRPPPAARVPAVPARKSAAAARAQPPVPDVHPEETVPDTAITLPPGTGTTDWGQQAELTARAFSAPVEDRQRSLDSRPEVLELPERTTGVPRKGDMSIGLDGTIGVWTADNVYCESRTLLMDQFETWAKSIPPHCRKREFPKPKPRQEYDLP